MLARPIRCEPFEKEVQKSLAEFRWAPVPGSSAFTALFQSSFCSCKAGFPSFSHLLHLKASIAVHDGCTRR